MYHELMGRHPCATCKAVGGFQVQVLLPIRIRVVDENYQHASNIDFHAPIVVCIDCAIVLEGVEAAGEVVMDARGIDTPPPTVNLTDMT